MRVTKFKPKEDPGTNKMGEQKYGVPFADKMLQNNKAMI